MNRPTSVNVQVAASIAIFLVLSLSSSPARAQDLWNSNTPYVASSSSWGSGWDSGGWNNGGWNTDWQGASSGNRQWTLGISGTNTDTGVVVDQVANNSAAARAGINRGDTIVSVDADRVGLVAGKVFELGDELNHHADSGGRVQLLIQDGRSLRLRSIVAQMSDRQAGLAGTLLVPGGRLPSDAVVSVQLENVSRPHYVVRNGEISFRVPPYSSNQIPFNLNYDPNYIVASDTYRVRASVTSGGRLIYETRQPAYVLTQGNPSSVQLRLDPPSYVAATGATNVNQGGVFTAGYANYDYISQQVTAAYERYLGRRPSAMELAAWHQVPDTQYRLSRLPLELMGSQEYYDRTGNNNLVWVRQVFGEVIGRTPTALELDQWMRRFSELGYSRTTLLEQMKSITKS
ncbi:PDZ domain-containing protein [Roseiconus nitratireducens]|uniref:PDZ domain-containing protein n=1 Tax=Roseiconus nitratireducens TaxID=2605748 RepID=A0A5M6D6V5_9BACT|nr:YbaY family lipoprotein [Roseiconus nitratireducens]KAA5540915.1 PDZ domain-containing protein [Roseiconus nitratireducens]